MAASDHPMAAGTAGFALVVVLWSIVLLAVLSSSFLTAMRAELRMAGNLHAAVQARLLTEAGFSSAILGLYHPDAELRPVADGTQHTVEIAHARVRYRLLDETARIDLNKAPGELIDGVIATLHVEPRIRAQLVDGILDWRDADALRRNHGTEDADYRAANYLYDAKDAPFDSVEELLLLPGMTHELYAQAAPLLTVYSGQSGIDPVLAPPQVLSALPGATPELTDAYLAARRTLRDAGRTPPLPDFIDSRHVVSGRGLVYTVYVSAELAHGNSAAIVATLRIQRNRPDQPIVILRWQESDSDQAIAAGHAADEVNS